MTETPNHTDALSRQFARVTLLADSAWDMLEEAIEQDEPITRLEARYKDWASLLMRYHDAMERVAGKDEGPQELGSMKAGQGGG